MPIPYPSHGGFIYASGSSYSPSASGSSYSPSRYLSYERPMEVFRNPLWECSYCKQTNSKESLECTHCGAGQLRSVKNPLLTAHQIFEELRVEFGGTE